MKKNARYTDLIETLVTQALKGASLSDIVTEQYPPHTSTDKQNALGFAIHKLNCSFHRPDLAVALGDAAIAQYPKAPAILRERTDALTDAWRLEDARDSLSRLQKLGHGIPRDRLIEAKLLFAEGNPAQAIALAQETVREHPKAEYLRIGLIRLLMLSGQMEEAKAQCTAMAEISPKHYTAQLFPAVIDLLEGKMEKAEYKAREAVQNYPKNNLTALVLSDILIARKKFDEAQALAAPIANKDASLMAARNSYAAALAAGSNNEGLLQAASAVIEQGREHFPQERIGAALSIMISLKNGEFDRATKEMNRAMENISGAERYNPLFMKLFLLMSTFNIQGMNEEAYGNALSNALNNRWIDAREFARMKIAPAGIKQATGGIRIDPHLGQLFTEAAQQIAFSIVLGSPFPARTDTKHIGGLSASAAPGRP